jgi:hypothetical protein
VLTSLRRSLSDRDFLAASVMWNFVPLTWLKRLLLSKEPLLWAFLSWYSLLNQNETSFTQETGKQPLLSNALTSLTLFYSNLNLPPGVSAPHGGAMQYVIVTSYFGPSLLKGPPAVDFMSGLCISTLPRAISSRCLSRLANSSL